MPEILSDAASVAIGTTIQYPVARGQGRPTAEARQANQGRREVARPAPQQAIQERPDVAKLRKFLPTRPVDRLVKLADNLKEINGGKRTQEAEALQEQTTYIGGVDLRKLAKLSELFPSTHINELTVCLLNNPELVPENLSLLCKVFPTRDPSELSDVANGNDFTPEVLEEAIKEKVQFSDKRMDASDIASALKQLGGGNLKSLLELSRTYPGTNIIDVVRLEQLKVIDPACDPKAVLAKLQELENGSSYEFVKLVMNGTIPSLGNAIDVVDQYQRYKNLMAKLQELFPNALPSHYATAWSLFWGVGSCATVGEFETLITDGTVNRGVGQGNPAFAMNNYVTHLRLSRDRTYSEETFATAYTGA